VEPFQKYNAHKTDVK